MNYHSLTKYGHLQYWFSHNRYESTYRMYYDHTKELACMQLGGIPLEPNSFIESLKATAREIAASHKNNFHIFLSGGLDSEVAVRCFVDAKIPFIPVIIKFAHELNLDDVYMATNLCSTLNLKPIVLDFDPIKFFKSDMWGVYFHKFQVYTFYQQLLMHIAETLAVPMITIDEIEIVKRENDVWKFIKKEDQDGCWHRFEEQTSIPAYNNFYTYDPQTIIEFMKSPRIQALIHNQIPGKLGWSSSKNEVYAELTNWDMIYRPKRHGMEKMMEIWNQVNREISMILPKNFSPIEFQFDALTLSNDIESGSPLQCIR